MIAINIVSATRKEYIQHEGPFFTKLAMENEHHFLRRIATEAWLRFQHLWTEEKLLNCAWGSDIDCARYMSTIILVIKPTVYYVELGNLRSKCSIEQVVQLAREERRRD
jgi:hypothetical protein